MRIALYQPDIAQNTGTILRLCACLGADAHIIEPAGFPVSDRHFRRAGMDYLDSVAISRFTASMTASAFEPMRMTTIPPTASPVPLKSAAPRRISGP